MAELKIDVQDLHKSFGNNEVLKGIDAKFYEGDVVCIIGPSGSGKSTFLRTLNLLESITSGKVVVDGYELSDKNTNVDKARENIGMVFQHFNLFPHLTVMGNLTLAPGLVAGESRADAEERAHKLLERVGLEVLGRLVRRDLEGSRLGHQVLCLGGQHPFIEHLGRIGVLRALDDRHRTNLIAGPLAGGDDRDGETLDLLADGVMHEDDAQARLAARRADAREAPPLTRSDAKVWRRSWIRTSASPAFF